MRRWELEAVIYLDLMMVMWSVILVYAMFRFYKEC